MAEPAGWDGSAGSREPAASGSRLDAAITARGLAPSRTRAAKLIADGLVTVDGHPIVKPSARVTDQQLIVVAAADHYVSRAAHKLVAALDEFELEVDGRSALDVGASTGGFTQVLLERGASVVIALDVGHGQLAPSIRADPRVSIVEGFNARFMTAEGLASAAGPPAHRTPDGASMPDIVVADLSFISLPTVLPALVATVGRAADYVLLVKPQFEVGRSGIREGIVRRPELRTDAVNGVLWAAWDLGLSTAGIVTSPIAGANGNHEYLVWLSASVGTNPTEWTERVTAMTEAN